jgi:uncharacterized membrane-anchored protein YitT (DUF2179 family)
MRNTWVKNVYNLGITGGTTSELFSPILSPAPAASIQAVGIHRVIPRVIPEFSPYLFTRFFINIPLLYTYLSPLSTTPIIKRTEEKKERNI